MAHFNFENTLTELTKLDAPLRGPMMRWQRKAQEGSGQKLSNSSGLCVSPRSARSSNGRTPGRTTMTPGSAKPTSTSGKTPGKGSAKTPNKKTPSKTPKCEDRFIPNRAATDFDMGHYGMMRQENESSEHANKAPQNIQYEQKLSEALLNGANPQDSQILAFKKKAIPNRHGQGNNLKVLYSTNSSCSAPKAANTRHIPQVPERILDAPELLDDYYLNLVDWSVNNHLAVALGGAVYLWNAGDGSIEQLMQMPNEEEYVSSVSWIKEANILAIGSSSGNVQLWDVSSNKSVRTMSGHAARVGCLAWNSYILSSGARSGAIHHHDVRVAEHHVATLSNHVQEVCGLEWSSDGRYLASGGNDNILNIWEASLGERVAPLHTLTQHQAAVKAISWCPWQTHILASGGGTADRHIRFWNAATGVCINAVDTNSQVCSIKWSKEYKELISGHGYSQNQLIIWKYPAMTKVTELKGHLARVLCLSMSPDGSTVVSVAADETLRLWKCFAIEGQTKPSSSKALKGGTVLNLHKAIR